MKREQPGVFMDKQNNGCIIGVLENKDTGKGSENLCERWPVHCTAPHSQLCTLLHSILAKVSSPTETDWCIKSLMTVFQKYAGKDGSKYILSKTEFLSLMNTKLAAFTKNQKDPGVLNGMMKKLDINCDGELDFQEFRILLMVWR